MFIRCLCLYCTVLLSYIPFVNQLVNQGVMRMKVTFAEVDRETLFLLPPSVQDWLPKGHLARFVVDIVEHLDLRSLKASYSGRGSQPYNPDMLVALLFYGYSTGVFSSRKLERSTYDSVAFRTQITIQLPASGGDFYLNSKGCS